MRIFKDLLPVITCAAFLSGCYYTIEPVYLEKDKISDDAILGTWGQPDKKEKWSFTKEEKTNTYISAYTDNNGVESTFKVTLAKIGKYKYFDMCADKKRVENQNGTFKALFLECHNFVRYSIENDKLVFVKYDLAWIDKKLKNKEIDLHYFVREGGYYFSDSTENLRKVIISLEDIKETFSKDLMVLERIK